MMFLGVFTILLLGLVSLEGAATTLECDNGDCVTVIDTTDEGWKMTVTCEEDGINETYYGSGPWTGTLCGVVVNGG